MAIGKKILNVFPGMNRYVGLMHAAPGADAFVNAVSEYLASWPKDKIENLQRVDGGWGPFDENGRPTRLRTMADVVWIGDTVRRHFVALKEAGIAPNPELVELEQCLSVARQLAQDRLAGKSHADRGAPHWGAGPQQTDSKTGRRQH
jgi:hypothetical protein